MELRVIGNVEHRVDPFHDVGVQRRQHRPDTDGARCEQQILNRREDRRGAAAATDGEGEYHDRSVDHLVGEQRRHLVNGAFGNIGFARPAILVAALGPPGLVVELAERANLFAVADDQKARRLGVASVRRL